MSTPADLKRMEAKRNKKMNLPLLPLPRNVSSVEPGSGPTTSSGIATFSRDSVSWMYQPEHHRQIETKHLHLAVKQAPQNGHYDFTVDSFGGRTFTDFTRPPSNQQRLPFKAQQMNQSQNDQKNLRNGQKNRSAPRPELPLPFVKETPISMNTMDFVIDPSNIVCFNGKFHFLSNMFPSPLSIEGNPYTSVEHYYQTTKVYTFLGPQKAQEMSVVTDASQAKSMAHRLLKSVQKDRIEMWKSQEAPKIIKVAIWNKFMDNIELKNNLVATGSSILAHAFPGDNVYATGTNPEGVQIWAKENAGKIYKIPARCEPIECIPLVAKGRNLLGALLMMVRRDISSDVKEPSPHLPQRQITSPEFLQDETDQAAELLKQLSMVTSRSSTA